VKLDSAKTESLLNSFSCTSSLKRRSTTERIRRKANPGWQLKIGDRAFQAQVRRKSGGRMHPFQDRRCNAAAWVKRLTSRQYKVIYLLAQGLTYK